MKTRKAKIKPRKWQPKNNLRKCHGCKVRYDCKVLDNTCSHCKREYDKEFECSLNCDGYWMRTARNRIFKCGFIHK